MEFRTVATQEAEGCILAHATKVGGQTFKKGRILSRTDVTTLTEASVLSIAVARLSPSDMDENVAADRIAHAAMGENLWLDAPFTGRVNLYAEQAGLFIADEAAVNALNRVDPAMTLATLPNYSKVAQGRMVATAKIIPFATSSDVVWKGEAAIAKALKVAPFRPHKIGLIATRLEHLKPGTMDKTRRVLQERLEPSGSEILAEVRIPHTQEAVAKAITELTAKGADILILFGASAVVDRNDILPSGIEAAGGKIIHFGMPVDPGNLLLLGEVGQVPVIGAPGCARSPKENGFDWVLDRLLAGLQVSSADITGLGVGGLLMEIESRPQPREMRKPSASAKVGAIILAAGKSSRMAGPNKLLARLDGKAVLRHVADTALDSQLEEVIVVTGHMPGPVSDTVKDLAVKLVHNPDFEDGMSCSIKAGISALSPEIDAAFVLLGDMPRISSSDLSAMIEKLHSSKKSIIMATADGKRGNPVLWDRRHFADLKTLSGDIGGKHLISCNLDQVVEVEIGTAARLDLDTKEALLAEGGEISE